MKIMFVCAGGMSTALTAKKLEEISLKNDVSMTVRAFGTTSYLKALESESYDLLLVAPQIRHRYETIKTECECFEGLVVEKIPPNMYAPIEPIVKNLYDFILKIIPEDEAK